MNLKGFEEESKQQNGAAKRLVNLYFDVQKLESEKFLFWF
jgi:hypothetical protein